MTAEEAIETIEIAIAEVEWNYPMEYAIAFEKAIEALEKQIAKKPVEGDTESLWVNDFYYCPSCEFTVAVGRYTDKYCPNCGQKLCFGDDAE